jgi:hypothetical protein
MPANSQAICQGGAPAPCPLPEGLRRCYLSAPTGQVHLCETSTVLPLLTQPVLILNPDNPLAEPSRRAAALMPKTTVRELPPLSAAVLDLAATELADPTDAWLGDEV